MMPLIYQSPVFFLFEKGKPNILAFSSLGKNTVRMAQVHFGYLIKMQPGTVVQFYNKRREPVLLRHEIVR